MADSQRTAPSPRPAPIRVAPPPPPKPQQQQQQQQQQQLCVVTEGHMIKHGSFLALSGQPRFMRLWSDGTLEGFKSPPARADRPAPNPDNKFNVLYSTLEVHRPFFRGARAVHQITLSFFDPDWPARQTEKRLFELHSKADCDVWVEAISGLPRVTPPPPLPPAAAATTAEDADAAGIDDGDAHDEEVDEATTTPLSATPAAKSHVKSQLETRLLAMAKKAGAQLCALKWTGTIKLTGKVFGVGLMVGLAVTRARISALEASGNTDAAFDEDDEEGKKDDITKKTLKFFDKAAVHVRSLANQMKLEGLTGMVGAQIDFSLFGTGLTLEIEVDVESIIAI